MTKVTFFDVEYANCKNKSICQIGLLSEYFPDRDPVFPEKNIYVLKDLCAGTTKENHEAALQVMRSCQIEII